MASLSRAGIRGMVLLATAILIAALSNASLAKDFRIETKIFVGDDKDAEPTSTATTLFLDGVVYDFIDKPAQVAVFRKPESDKPGRFILLDPEHHIRTELKTDQLAGAMDKLKTWAGRQKDPFLQFAANPKFDEAFKSSSGELVLASNLESYTVTTTPVEHPQAIDEYREYLDWYAKLNTLLSAGPPPEPRLQLNDALARHRVVPLKVELTRSGDAEPIRAEHSFTWRLSREDAERIDKVRASLASYREVSNDVFLRSMQPEQNVEK